MYYYTHITALNSIGIHRGAKIVECYSGCNSYSACTMYNVRTFMCIQLLYDGRISNDMEQLPRTIR